MGLEEAAYYDALGERYGWTPTVVDEQPYDLVQRMLVIAQVKDEVMEERAKA